MIKNTILLLTMICLLYSCSGVGNPDIEAGTYLAQLDSALNNKEEYRKILDSKLVSLKQKAELAQSTEARYFYNKLIYENYNSFNYDSAFHYIDMNYALATEYQKTDWIVECHLANAKIHIATGFLDAAHAFLDKAGSLPMSHEIKLEYYVQQINYWSMVSIHRQTPLMDEVHAYGDSLMVIETNESSPYHLWGRFWNEKDDAKKAEVRRLIIRKVSTMDKEDMWYASLCFAVGILSGVTGDKEDELEYYVKSLCVDISHVSRSVPSLLIVANIACEMGELTYANRFMKAYLAIQEDFPDRVRGSFIYRPIMRLYDATVLHLIKETQNRNIFIGCLLGMAIILLVSLLFVYMLFKKQVKLRKQLIASNRELDINVKLLSEHKEKLQQANNSLLESSRQVAEVNKRLQEASFLKEEYIGKLFAVCSGYLEKMMDFRKTTHRKLKARQYDDLLQMTASNDTQTLNELKEFNHHFDTIFLSIFPDFLEEFNSLLQPEERIVVRSGEKLNTDLRIYALVRLGINNSVKISKILGVSSQTIYNSRMKMRGRATISDDEFVSRVRELGGWKVSSEPTSEEA